MQSQSTNAHGVSGFQVWKTLTILPLGNAKAVLESLSSKCLVHPVVEQYLKMKGEEPIESETSEIKEIKLVQLKVRQIAALRFPEMALHETVRSNGVERGLKLLSFGEVCALALHLHGHDASEFHYRPMMEQSLASVLPKEIVLYHNDRGPDRLKGSLLVNLVISHKGVGASQGYMGSESLKGDDVVIFKLP